MVHKVLRNKKLKPFKRGLIRKKVDFNQCGKNGMKKRVNTTSS